MKTAKEWQQHLGLDELPDDEFVTALNSLEGQDAVDGGGLEAQGLVAAHASPAELVSALVVESAGEAFKAVRQEQGLTVRQAAESWGVSPGRVSQMESPEANLYMSTVGSAALRMGYRAKLVLEPLDGGQPIEASLGQ
ncbi:helix-turn-helix domain-containing protein [Deinococcus sp. SL84]|uniref:helix-turn-helix domain-containing protein n=1 Tax=Deinococcus sp. SL84 TaxID=2994663 RepID=UPI0022737044|nr:helix-turn-helix transcriptional regulator [Deinococcus sp. SL84]MCY1704274.1 helix-turn-helix transcriptional regulator [Deinococcus sp. SL84]